ncbi:hypothetical protein [Vibrio zhugei]|uniref:hypothetical protein n=1 Tax=Vibrio zhugei TaxID=2479546 RepID=UPI000F0B65BA|nr:hypothetical protein [Vibrio zhugei]
MNSELPVLKKQQKRLTFLKDQDMNKTMERVVVGLAISAVAVAVFNSCFGLLIQGYIAKLF